MRSRQFPVVSFNAWENDFSNNPFVSLAAELTEGLRGYADKSIKPEFRERVKKLIENLRGNASEIAGIVAAGISGVDHIEYVGALSIAVKFVGRLVKRRSEEKLNKYSGAKNLINNFKKTMQKTANELAESSGGKPLIVVIDEIDRCRPTYAIELLEVAKHLFNVDGIVFVLPINRDQLANSLKGLYGSEFDGEGYLRRFIDLDFTLPNPRRVEFIDAMLEKIRFIRSDKRDRELLQHFFRSSALSLRQIAQATHRLGLVLTALPTSRWWVPTAAAIVLLILRTINRNLYLQFIRGDASDIDVADAVFKFLNLTRIYDGSSKSHYTALFEAILIVGPHEMGLDSDAEMNSNLLRKYKEMPMDKLTSDPAQSYVKEVIKFVDQIKDQCLNNQFYYSGGIGFHESIQCLELLSPELNVQSYSL